MYNINTKAKRTELLNHIKESRLNKGFNLEIFEGLQIFTKFDELVNKHFLEVYCDNSTKPLLNYYYTDEAQMLTRIQTTKDNYLSRKKYKEERKANQGKKITLATLKTFFNKNSDNIYIKELSRFDGMVDCVMPTKDDFSKVERKEVNDRDLGFSGCWLVGSSRDSIAVYEDDIYTGFQVYNSCGSWIAATPKQVKKEVSKPTQAEVKQGSVNIVTYGKGLAVIGETYAIKDKLKAIGGRFNKFLTVGAGWVFTSDKLEEIKSMLLSLKESKEVEQAEEVQEVSTEETKQAEIKPLKVLPIPQSNKYKLESLKIIWHEGLQTPSFEGKTFNNWDDIQAAFLMLWDVNESNNNLGGYTKVKIELKFINEDPQTFRVDITNKINNGDFNPLQEHIITHLQSLEDEEQEEVKIVTLTQYANTQQRLLLN